jgi:ribose 5-phosphate isomerase A
VIADYTADFEDPGELARRLADTVGVVEHGLFPAPMVTQVVVARGEQVEIRDVPGEA